MRLLTLGSIKLPPIYVCENSTEVSTAKMQGLPYVKWNGTDEELARRLLLPTLEKLFPRINFAKLFGWRRKQELNVIVHDKGGADYSELPDDTGDGLEDVSVMSDTQRKFNAKGCEQRVKLEDFCGSLSSHVNMEELAQLKLLPEFVGEIVDIVSTNSLSSVQWMDGYNKKHGSCVGYYSGAPLKKNLMIIDCSASIPRGIRDTMISLADTMRSWINCDLIFTSAHSMFYKAGEPLPDPDTLSEMLGRCNESEEFANLLKDKVAGNQYGNIISFGDWDTPTLVEPDYWGSTTNMQHMDEDTMAGTTCEKVWHFHTSSRSRTGYAAWVHKVCPSVQEEYNMDWAAFVKEDWRD